MNEPDAGVRRNADASKGRNFAPPIYWRTGSRRRLVGRVGFSSPGAAAAALPVEAKPVSPDAEEMVVGSQSRDTAVAGA